jgi:hypothetical protein
MAPPQGFSPRLITIMNMGGRKSLRMVQRYSSVSINPIRGTINRVN